MYIQKCDYNESLHIRNSKFVITSMPYGIDIHYLVVSLDNHQIHKTLYNIKQFGTSNNVIIRTPGVQDISLFLCILIKTLSIFQCTIYHEVWNLYQYLYVAFSTCMHVSFGLKLKW